MSETRPTSTGPARVNWQALRPFLGLAAAAALFVSGLVAYVAFAPQLRPQDVLQDAESLLRAGEHERALQVLNKQMLPFAEDPKTPESMIRRFHILRAQAVSDAQSARGIDHEQNHTYVRDDYRAAERLGAKLEPDQTERMVHAQLALGDYEDAAERTRGLSPGEGERRRRLIRSIVVQTLEKGVQRTLALNLLDELIQESGLSLDDRAWALERQGDLLLASGHPGEARDRLQREMQAMPGATDAQLGRLYVLLGRAHADLGDAAMAERRLEQGLAMLTPDDPARAGAEVLAGRLVMASTREGRFEEASELFRRVITEHPGSPARLAALLGLGECAALLGRHEEAIELFAEVSDAVVREPTGLAVERPELTRTLMDRYADLASRGANDMALRYAELSERLYDDELVPALVLDGLGRTHRAVAGEELREAVAAEPSARLIGSLDPVTRENVKRHYLLAGKAFERHAIAIVREDVAAASESRWLAADCYDLAGELGEAYRMFEEFIELATDTDPKRPEARYRLARVLQARREFEPAGALFRELIEQTDTDKGVGIWGDRSIVPLAQCLLAMAPDSPEEARSLLLRLVDGTRVEPEAYDFREALIELGRLHYRTATYADAIERLGEAASRYPEDDRITAIRFALGDSYRLSARELEAALEQGGLPRQEVDALRTERQTRLQSAMSEFAWVQRELEAIPYEARQGLDEVYLRNASFYLGDCAFELGMYDEAIAFYEAARRRYRDDPASLVAMVQIVNAYVQQGKYQEARTANERAREQLSRLPAEVWERSDLPMDQAHWERWLDSTALLEELASAG